MKSHQDVCSAEYKYPPYEIFIYMSLKMLYDDRINIPSLIRHYIVKPAEKLILLRFIDHFSSQVHGEKIVTYGY